MNMLRNILDLLKNKVQIHFKNFNKFLYKFFLNSIFSLYLCNPMIKKTFSIPFTVLVNCEGTSKRIETSIQVKAYSLEEAQAKVKYNTYVGSIAIK